MTSVAFVANFQMTETYLAVARELERRQPELRVTWFSFSGRWLRWLQRQGVPGHTVHHLSAGEPAHHGRAAAGASDMTLGEFEPSLVEAIEGDRVLRQRPLSESVDLLCQIMDRACDQIAKLKVDYVFGESTWAAEIALAYGARSLGVPYLSPASVRYPIERFGFFEAPLQRFPVPLRASDEADWNIGEETLRWVRSEGAPKLWAANDLDAGRFLRQPTLLLEKLLNSFSDACSNPTQMTLPEYLRSKHPVRLRRWSGHAHSVMHDASTAPAEIREPFVLMPLQLQPEASIDVMAWWARDQVANVRRVARATQGRALVGVKEHTHQFGSRDPVTYERLRSIPGVFVIDAFSDSRAWAAEALAVVSPTGTMAFEHALRGGQSFVMSPVFFERLPNVHLLSPHTLSELELLGGDQEVSDEGMIRVLTDIVAASHPGVVANPRSSPEVLRADNVSLLASGFEQLLGGSHLRS